MQALAVVDLVRVRREVVTLGPRTKVSVAHNEEMYMSNEKIFSAAFGFGGNGGGVAGGFMAVSAVNVFPPTASEAGSIQYSFAIGVLLLLLFVIAVVLVCNFIRGHHKVKARADKRLRRLRNSGIRTHNH